MGFGKEVTAAEVVAGHDLSGREVIVTGGTSGIGIETARALAGAGARVLVTGRDPTKGTAAVAELRASTGNPAIEFEPLELGRLADVARFTRSYRTTGRPLHLLVDNAAILTTSLSYTENGFETHLGVNHLGHFALTLGLLSALTSAGTARVVVLSSRAHRHGDVDFDDPNYRRRTFRTWPAYGQSKTANALFAVAFTARYARDGITANAVMPGMVMTELPRYMSHAELGEMGWLDAAGNLVAPPGWKSAEQGAATTVWAAVAPELAGVGGRYLEDCAIGQPWSGAEKLPTGHYHTYALDPDRAELLWSLSERLLADSPDHD